MKEKSLSIPRLELQVAVLGARIKSTIIEQVHFQINNITLFSDSKVTLNCISNSNRKFPFVINRLNEIRTNTEIKQWKYIPGDLNPADICTHYHSFQYLNSDSIWIRGPNFLYRNENVLPWMGGAMEALVKIIKRCLKAVVKDRLLHEDTLHTLLLEI